MRQKTLIDDRKRLINPQGAKIIGVLMLCMAIFMFLPMVSAENIVSQFVPSSFSYNSYASGSSQLIGQSFNTTANAYLSKIELVVGRNSATTGNVFIRLRNGTNFNDILTTNSSISIGSIGLGPSPYNFTFPSIYLTAGQPYFISVECPLCDGDGVALNGNNSNSYLDGGAYKSLDNGSTWVTTGLTTVDFAFKVYNDTAPTPPISFNITLNNPSDNSILSTDGSFFNATFQVDNINSFSWKNATFYIYSNNGSIFRTNFTTLSGVINISNRFVDDFILGQNYKWNVLGCFGNATFNNCTYAPSNFTFTNLPFNVNAVSYENYLLETARSNFTFNITTNPSVSAISGYFWYNGTRYSPTLTAKGSGVYSSFISIDIPLAPVTGNKTFFWEFNTILDDTSTLNSNSSIYSHEVNRTFFTFCNTTFTTQFINFSTKSAENPFPAVNTTFKVAWESWLGSGSVKRSYNYEDVTENLSFFKFCMNYNQTLYINAHIEYDASGFSLNSYYLDNASLTNAGQAISLYTLNDTKATVTTIKVVDSGQQPISDVLIQIQFYDVGTGTFYTVGMGKTDFKGEEIAYLNWYDTLYKFILIKDGKIIKITDTTRISATPVSIVIGDTYVFPFDKFRDFQYSLTFNNVSNNFVLTFTKPSGLVDQGCLRVIKRSASNDTQICLTCESSASATVYCNINGYGNGTYIAVFYATGSGTIVDWMVITIGGSFADSIYDLLGNEDATFYAFLFVGICLTMFFIHPIFGIFGLILGMLGASALGFAPINYAEFIGITIIGGLIVWLIKR